MRKSQTPLVACCFAIVMCAGLSSPVWAVSFTAIGQFTSNSVSTPGLAGDSFQLTIDVDSTNDGPASAGFRFNGTGDLQINGILIYDDISARILQAAEVLSNVVSEPLVTRRLSQWLIARFHHKIERRPSLWATP